MKAITYEGREYAPEDLPQSLADDALPVTPGEIGNAEAVPAMLDELCDLRELLKIGPYSYVRGPGSARRIDNG